MSIFRTVLDGNLRIMTLGARQHGLLASSRQDAIAAAFERDDWTCHVCSTRLYRLMEIDHLKGHKPCDSSDLSSICQFCHDLRHPLWAASLKRMIPIDAPDIEQVALTRLAWAALVSKGAELESNLLADAVEPRVEAAQEILGGANLDAVFEAVLSIGDLRGKAEATEICDRLDTRIRFIPAIILEKTPTLLSWTVEGFKPVASEEISASVAREDPPLHTLRAAASALA